LSNSVIRQTDKLTDKQTEMKTRR